MLQMKTEMPGGKSHIGQTSHFWQGIFLLVFLVGLKNNLLDMGIVWILSLPSFLLLEIFLVWNPVSVVLYSGKKERKRVSDSGFQIN